MEKLHIKDMAEDQKPYEKAVSEGIGSLSDAELLALILRSGTSDRNVIELARLILNRHPVHKGLYGINYLSFVELMKIKGVGKVKACQIMAIAELSRRMSVGQFKSNLVLNSPSAIADYFMETCRYLTKERIYALFLNGSNSLIQKVILSEGTVNRSLISPREIFMEALRYDAVSLVLLHNHPSGNPEPSNVDITVSKRIKELGDILGIRLLDHIVVGDNSYVSLVERGIL